MTMFEFQMLAMATMPNQNETEHIKSGVIALSDHAEEAALQYAQVEKAKNADTYVEARSNLKKIMGFLLVDIAQICDGMGAFMSDIVLENFSDLLKQRMDPLLTAQTKEKEAMGVLRSIFEMAGKVVQKDE